MLVDRPDKAGRAAEEPVFGHLSAGAAEDLAEVTDIAGDRVTRHGVVEQLGCVAYQAQPPRLLDAVRPTPGGCPVSPATREPIEEALRGIVTAAFEQATVILERHRETLDRCARELQRREMLDEAALRELTKALRAVPAAAGAAGVNSRA